MTFRPSQVLTTEQWRARHAGHTVAQETYELGIKRMFFWQCETCEARHFWKMETIGGQRDQDLRAER